MAGTHGSGVTVLTRISSYADSDRAGRLGPEGPEPASGASLI